MKASVDSKAGAQPSSDGDHTFGGTVTAVTPVEPPVQASANDVKLRQYTGEEDLPHVMRLIDNELSEPYSIFTYRYFLHTWPKLCFLAFHQDHCFGTVVCKMEPHKELMRGYIAMLVVEKAFRGLGIGTQLVRVAVGTMMQGGDLDEVVLEAEVTNLGALSLYTHLGFIRDKRLARYYMNGVDAFRLKLLLPLSPEKEEELAAAQLSSLGVGPHAHDHNHTCSHSHPHSHPHNHHHPHEGPCNHQHHPLDHGLGHPAPHVHGPGCRHGQHHHHGHHHHHHGPQKPHVHGPGCSHHH